MKKSTATALLSLMVVTQSVGNDFIRYLEPGAKYRIAPGKRDELVSHAMSGSGRGMRASNALLAFEALGKAQENNRYEFPDAKRHARAAMADGTNDWINILAGIVLTSANNLQRGNEHRHSGVTNTVALFQKTTPAVWEMPDNPIYHLWAGEEQVTAEKLRQMLSACIIDDYCSLHRFDEAEAFLASLPDSQEKHALKRNVDAQKRERAFSLESIRRNQQKQKEQMR